MIFGQKWKKNEFEIFFEFSNITKKLRLNARSVLAFLERDILIQIKTELSSFKTQGGDRFGDFLKNWGNIEFFLHFDISSIFVIENWGNIEYWKPS